MKFKEAEDAREAFTKLTKVYAEMSVPFQILLVEDDARDIELINRVIGSYRVSLRVALTGEAAIEWMGRENYDLCIMDLKLSRMSGVEVIRWAKSNGKEFHFIVLTGLNERSELIAEALDAGAKCIIQKPLSQNDMQMILGSVR